MTNSRDKFKTWFEKQYGCAPTMRGTTDYDVYIGWLAGRESMRDEAAEQWDECIYESISESIDVGAAIRKIQP